MMLDLLFIATAEIIKPQAILLEIDQLKEISFDLQHRRSVSNALKD